jgi:hypothetical protein
MLQIQFCLLLLLLPSVQRAFAGPEYLGYSNYQIITDFSFDPVPYFQQMDNHAVNLQRIWILGYSNSADKINETMPFVLAGKKYDLKRIDPMYLQRLIEVLQAAEMHNQQVMLTLFDHWSLATSDVFPQTPWFFKNNTDRLLRKPFPEFYDMRNRKLVQIQRNYVEKIVRASASFSPIYEIMNEAGGTDCDTLNRWHKQVADWIKEFAPDARIAVNMRNTCTDVLNQPWVDVVSFHADVWQKNGICNLAEKYRDTKTVIIDTDGAWRVRHDNDLIRTWLRQSLSCGASFNHKDDIYTPDPEALQIFQKAGQETESEQPN